jgi:uncharacterized membrane protein YphA (DoxX/SURF4 family)
MNRTLQSRRGPTEALRNVLLVRIAVGLIFFSQGILKYIDPNLGVVRFTRIGFPHPYFTPQFVGAFEILCGLLLLMGLLTRIVSVSLPIVITTAIATTKIPELFRVNQSFWYMVSDARTGFAMFCCLVFLISVGGGSWSLDTMLAGGRLAGKTTSGILKDLVMVGDYQEAEIDFVANNPGLTLFHQQLHMDFAFTTLFDYT